MPKHAPNASNLPAGSTASGSSAEQRLADERRNWRMCPLPTARPHSTKIGRESYNDRVEEEAKGQSVPGTLQSLRNGKRPDHSQLCSMFLHLRKVVCLMFHTVYV
jgi:hypothetical protein